MNGSGKPQGSGFPAKTWNLTVGLGETLHEVVGHLVDLHGQLPRGRDDNRPQAVAGHELGPVQQLQAGDQERQRLARPCTHVRV